jgi:hypothetical protein
VICKNGQNLRGNPLGKHDRVLKERRLVSGSWTSTPVFPMRCSFLKIIDTHILIREGGALCAAFFWCWVGFCRDVHGFVA